MLGLYVASSPLASRRSAREAQRRAMQPPPGSPRTPALQRHDIGAAPAAEQCGGPRHVFVATLLRPPSVTPEELARTRGFTVVGQRM